MSYLVLPTGIPNFSKAVISLWFRVPQATIDAKIAYADALPAAWFLTLQSTIPLLTFGQPQTAPRYTGSYRDVSVWHYTPPFPLTTTPIYDSPTYSVVADDPLDPSYIGILCETVVEDGQSRNRARLAINIQMGNNASVLQMVSNRSKVDVYPFGEDPPGYSDAPGSGWTAGTYDNIFGIFFTTLKDTSSRDRPEHFSVVSPHELTPDHWHHLLLSFDVSNACITRAAPLRTEYATVAEGVTSHAFLWYAIDDVDYRGDENLGPFGVSGGNPNAILTNSAWEVATNFTQYPFNCRFGPATCDYEPQPVPSNEAELGIPASTAYVDHILKVEMAEFQMWTGITLDTGIVAKRRAFVDVNGKPVKPDAAEKLLGRKPEVLLHGTGNWKLGNNTGSLGVASGGEPARQFRQTGVINKYTPDPSLHGSQGPKAVPVQLTRAAATLDAGL